ncbi:MAG: MXAN_6640 family putative metalloprotease [Myxococcota bacterium]
MELRPDSPESTEIFRYRPSDQVQSFDALDIRVHFVEEGPNAVPDEDEDLNDLPDYVELVADRYQGFWDDYVDLGFRTPLSDENITDGNGGDGRFDVYLLDFFGRADGAFSVDACEGGTCTGYAAQENDFAGYGYPSLEVATDILASHELFHAVQAAYDDGQGSILREGTAVWATEALVPSSNDFEGFIGFFLAEPQRSLDQEIAGVVLDGFAYGSALFFQFLTEYYRDPDLVRRLWLRCTDGTDDVADPEWLLALDRLLVDAYESSFAEAYVEFALWNAFSGERHRLGTSYAQARRYPSVAADAVELPLVLERPRHFRASARYRRFALDGSRSTIAAQLAGPDADRDGLRLVVLLWGPDGARFQVGQDAASLEVESEEEGLLIVVNDRMRGGSARASVCAGDVEETAACVAAFEPEPDPDPEPDPEPEPEPGTDPSPSAPLGEDEAGGCRTPGGPIVGAPLLLWWRRWRL